MKDIDKIINEARAGVMPFESWELLTGETSSAFAAFCLFRDFKDGRNIRKVIDSVEKDEIERSKRYRMWRNWAAQYRWRERAADYDRYHEKLKQREIRKTIEVQGEKHREVTEKMLDVVIKKLDTMNPEDLTQGTVTDWVQTAVKVDREACQFADANCLGVPISRNSTLKQGELSFVSDFQGL